MHATISTIKRKATSLPADWEPWDLRCRQRLVQNLEPLIKLVIAIIGDGGFQMTLQELGTILQSKVDVKIIILNNRFLGMVRQWQQLFFEKRYSFTEMISPDFVALSKAYSIEAAKVEVKLDVKEALLKMLNHKGSYLLEVVVAKEENVFPMIPTGASVSEIRLN